MAFGDEDSNEFGNIVIRSRLHEKVTRWTNHWSFGGTIMLVIAANAITLAVGTDSDLGPNSQKALKVLENIFLAVYTLEFLIKMYVSPTAYFTSGFNLFDFLVLVLSWVDLGLSETSSGQSASLSGLRILRILRTLRALRTVSFVPSLQVIVTALMVTFRTYMLNLMLVLFLIMFIFGVMGYNLYGGISRSFGSLGESMLALFTMVAMDSWTEVHATIKTASSSAWFCAGFIFVGSYIFTNVFVSIIIINLNDATKAWIDADKAQRKEIVAQKTITMNQKQKEEAVSFRLFLEQDRRAKFADYSQLLGSVKGFLKSADRPKDEIYCGDSSLNLLFIQQYLATLDEIDNSTYIQKCLYRELTNIIGINVEKRRANELNTSTGS